MFRLVERVKNYIFEKEAELTSKKIAFVLLVLNVITSSAVSIYIPCMKQIAVDFHTTNAMMQMTIVAHLIGEFVGRLFCGPMLLSFRKKSVILPALTIAILGQLGCFLSQDIVTFIIMRFLQAIGASCIYVISVSIINDLFDESEKGPIIGVLELYQPIAWILSPFIGCILSEIGSWRLSFLLLLIFQIFGRIFFLACLREEKPLENKEKFCLKTILFNYIAVLKNSAFLIYSIIPGLFAGGYMIFASNTPFICAQFLGNNSANIAIFQAIPLVFYVLATFAYRYCVKNLGVRTSKRIGTTVYICFGIYITLLTINRIPWSAESLLALMCLQCIGSAFLVPVSILKALQLSAHLSAVGASAVVVFRNIIMSTCITVTTCMRGDVTMVMSAVFMTVGTAILLIMTRRIIKTIANRRSQI